MAKTGSASIVTSANEDLYAAFVQPDTEVSGTLGSIVARLLRGYAPRAAALVSFTDRTINFGTAPASAQLVAKLADFTFPLTTFQPDVAGKTTNTFVTRVLADEGSSTDVEFEVSASEEPDDAAVRAVTFALRPEVGEMSIGSLVSRLEDSQCAGCLVVQTDSGTAMNLAGESYDGGIVIGWATAPSAPALAALLALITPKMLVNVTGSLTIPADFSFE